MIATQPFAAALFGLTVLGWVAVELSQAVRGRADAASTDRYSLLVLRVCLTAGVLLATLIRPRVPIAAFPQNAFTFDAGLVLLWVGIVLRWWCFRMLGRYFTFTVMTSTDQTVITAGPYRVVRHPSYAAILLALTGVGLILGNWASLATVLLLPSIGLAYRIHVEESALATALGTRYTSYASGRKRLIPYVW